jgi:signal transduction histidine kinase
MSSKKKALIEDNAENNYPVVELTGLVKEMVAEEKTSDNYYQEIEQLRDSQERYNLSQSLGQFGCFELNLKTGNFWLSKEAFNICGIKNSTTDFSFDQFKTHFSEEDKDKFEKALTELLDKKTELNSDLKFYKRNRENNETVILNIRACFIVDLRRKISKISGIIRDITLQKKTEADLLKQKRTAEESDRLKSAFLANMSHEIRTPMNAIIGFSELLNIGDLPYDKRKEYASIIKNKGNVLLNLIDDIIEISKFENGQLSVTKSEFNLYDFLCEIQDVFEEKKRSLGKDNVDIILKIPKEDTVAEVYTDPGRLNQIFSNLMNNALQFTFKGSIKFGYKMEDNRKIRFFVKDTGVGLTKKEQKHIFNRFRQVEETTIKKFSGSGLGLTISKIIVDLLGGKINLKSEINIGSNFSFTIPVELPPKKGRREPRKENSTFDYNWKDKVILIVEDEDINYKFLEAVLQKTEVQFIHATDGMQAVELCKSINKIDMILMDIKMPELNGFEATKQIKLLRKDIPIIAQTAFSMTEDKNRCFKAGCDDYIAKPIDIETLYRKINRFFI